MDFLIIANIFEKLENTSKRLEKVLILRDFLLKNSNESGILFDIISGDFTRKINKKNLGISLKTTFGVIAFLSNTTQLNIEKKFNKVGDIGIIARDTISKNKQGSLFNKKKLLVEDIILTFNKISKTTGKDSQKVKKEILSKLFLYANEDQEYKFLARILIDDLRIGVSSGVLKEASVNYFFPKFVNIHYICSNCNYINLNLKKCFNCNSVIDQKNQIEVLKNEFKIVEIGSPNEVIGLEEFIDVRENIEELKYIIRNSNFDSFIKTENPRTIYNSFLKLFELKYNLINSFEEIFDELNIDIFLIFDSKIKIGNPVRSMLGTRAKTINESFKMVKKPALLDFKYDGLRVQIHNDFGKVTLFSRNLDNITKQFPEVVKYIKYNFSDLCFVVDSECVAYDFKNQKFLPFQMLSRRILTKNIDEVSHIKIIVKIFDLLFLNGKTLIEEPYKKRRELLGDLIINRPIKQELCFDVNKLKKITVQKK